MTSGAQSIKNHGTLKFQAQKVRVWFTQGKSNVLMFWQAWSKLYVKTHYLRWIKKSTGLHCARKFIAAWLKLSQCQPNSTCYSSLRRRRSIFQKVCKCLFSPVWDDEFVIRVRWHQETGATLGAYELLAILEWKLLRESTWVWKSPPKRAEYSETMKWSLKANTSHQWAGFMMNFPCQ